MKKKKMKKLLRKIYCRQLRLVKSRGQQISCGSVSDWTRARSSVRGAYRTRWSIFPWGSSNSSDGSNHGSSTSISTTTSSPATSYTTMVTSQTQTNSCKRCCNSSTTRQKHKARRKKRTRGLVTEALIRGIFSIRWETLIRIQLCYLITHKTNQTSKPLRCLSIRRVNLETLLVRRTKEWCRTT